MDWTTVVALIGSPLIAIGGAIILVMVKKV